MRKKLIVANWKMHKTLAETEKFMQRFPNEIEEVSGIEIVICAPFISLGRLVDLMRGTPLNPGAQNMHWQKEGAYTGEISPLMLKEIGVKYVIIGHSERRKYFGENDVIINKKTTAALNNGLIPILCLGENLEERRSKKTEKVLKEQLYGALDEADPGEEKLQRIVLAYEPVWAIGTGTPAGGDEAADVAGYLRSLLNRKWGALSEKVRILYGGSVNEDNITQFTGKKDIDGALVGGSSLKESSFAGLIKAVFYEGRS
ncbi:MAG TPA: triose-phosphate isomerase [Firmicutes bacterium]|nr:triose-phosphate isomerase [Bacillota bacterium]